MNDLATIYTWEEVKQKKIELCYCKCCACQRPQLKKALTHQQQKRNFFFCQKCHNYIKKQSIKDICLKYNIDSITAGDYKLCLQLHKQDCKLSNDQKIIARIATFQKDIPKSKRWGYTAFYKKFGTNPRCYLTGTYINLDDINSWSLDHIIPKSKGGSSNLSNCAIVTKQINLCKHILTPEEFIEICKSVVDFNKSTDKIEE